MFSQLENPTHFMSSVLQFKTADYLAFLCLGCYKEADRFLAKASEVTDSENGKPEQCSSDSDCNTAIML